MITTNKKRLPRAVSSVVCAILIFILAGNQTVLYAASDNTRLIPGGVPFGVKLYAEGVSVVGIADVKCGIEGASPARDAGILEKDIILALNGKRISAVTEVSDIVAASEGAVIKVTVRRGNTEFTTDLTPVRSSEDGKYKAGLWIRDGAAGIGTVTYVSPEDGSFAGLGHGICESGTTELAPLKRGAVVNVTVSGLTKGQVGAPGELKGYFSSGKIGTLFGNTECGVYGVFAKYPDGLSEQAVEVASVGEICVGEAELWCTTDGGGVGKYAVKISEVDHSGRHVKNFVVTVTDPLLLEKTGGIVQGMSGSPILQNGKLVGALTHVLVNDPTRGYGIFIENMLSVAK